MRTPRLPRTARTLRLASAAAVVGAALAAAPLSPALACGGPAATATTATATGGNGSSAKPTSQVSGLRTAAQSATPAAAAPAARTAATIRGIVWHDVNHDGQRATGEKRMAGIKVLLFPGQAATPSQSTVTDQHGRYSFTVKVGTTGTVEFGAPGPGWGATYDDVGSKATNSDAWSGTSAARKHYFAYASASAYFEATSAKEYDVDAGFVRDSNEPARIAGRLWNDADRDGVRDKAELPVAGVKVVYAYERGCDGALVVETATTDAQGRFLFRDGTWIGASGINAIYLAAPTGWRWSPKSTLTRERASAVPAEVRKALGTNRELVTQKLVPAPGQTRVVDGALVAEAGAPTLPVTGPAEELAATSGGLLVAGGTALMVFGRRRGRRTA